MVRRFLLAIFGIVCGAVRLQAQASAPLAARDIARGVELTAADIAGDSTSAPRIGWVTHRVIREGEPLKEPAVTAPQLVKAGSEVTIRAETSGVIVTRIGTALSSGALGDRVRVRLDPLHTITGIVASSAIVKIQ